MYQAHDDPRAGLILIGFSPPDRLAALARHLTWPGRVLADQQRALYRRLGVVRAPLWRVYSPATLATYAAAAARGHRLGRPAEDTRQLGADAIMAEGWCGNCGGRAPPTTARQPARWSLPPGPGWLDQRNRHRPAASGRCSGNQAQVVSLGRLRTSMVL